MPVLALLRIAITLAISPTASAKPPLPTATQSRYLSSTIWPFTLRELVCTLLITNGIAAANPAAAASAFALPPPVTFISSIRWTLHELRGRRQADDPVDDVLEDHALAELATERLDLRTGERRVARVERDV